jgi:WD40 repeat protein
MKLSFDGKSLWSVGRFDQRVIRWNTATAEAAEVVPIPSSSFIFGEGVLSPGGAFLAWGAANEKTMHLMDLKTRKDACESLHTETDVFSAQFSPDGKVLAVGCKGGLFYGSSGFPVGKKQ